MDLAQLQETAAWIQPLWIRKQALHWKQVRKPQVLCQILPTEYPVPINPIAWNRGMLCIAITLPAMSRSPQPSENQVRKTHTVLTLVLTREKAVPDHCLMCKVNGLGERSRALYIISMDVFPSMVVLWLYLMNEVLVHDHPSWFRQEVPVQTKNQFLSQGKEYRTSA